MQRGFPLLVAVLAASLLAPAEVAAAQPAPPAPPAVPKHGGSSGTHDPTGADRDCGDFHTRADAHAFFAAARQLTGQRDKHRLDADGDGIACESLP